MRKVEVIDDFLPEDLARDFVGQLTTVNVSWNVSQEYYDAESMLDSSRDVFSFEDEYKHLLDQHGFSPLDKRYDIQNVLVVRDINGQNLNSDQPIPAYPWVDNFFIEKLGVRIPLRTKINMSFCKPSRMCGGFHVDNPHLYDLEHNTCVLYLNDNDGGTLLEDGTFVESKFNRCVVFDGRMKHAPISHTNTARRIVLNYNFI
jgi:hypothetical protein